MTDADIFGPILSASRVEDAVIKVIQDWSPVYLEEMTIIEGEDRGSLPALRSYHTVDDLEKFEEDQLPGVIVISPGLADRPRMDGEGHFTAEFELGIAVAVSAIDHKSTNRMAKVYTAMLRAIMLQKGRSAGGICAGIEWLDESYDDLGEIGDQRTLGIGVLNFTITVADVVNRDGGPRTYPEIEPPDPVTQPGSDWPEAESVEVTIEKEGVA